MKRMAAEWVLLAVLSLIAVAYFLKPAGAAEAGWEAEMWEVEGGTTMAAHVSLPATADNLPPRLVVICYGAPTLQYDPVVFDGSWIGMEPLFSFDFGGETISRNLVYEDMDGVFTAPLPDGDPLRALIETAGTVTVSTDGLPSLTFPLAGSRSAIAEVARYCS